MVDESLLEFLMNQKISTASKIPEQITDVPFTMLVISAKEIQEREAPAEDERPPGANEEL